MKHNIIIMLIVTLLFSGCITSNIERSSFGKTKKGENVERFTLRNKKGAELSIMTYGATVLSLKVPDRNGKFEDIVLGFDKFSDYEDKSPYFGAIVGRYANRIGNATFSIDGKTYSLAKNNNGQSLHGGGVGFDKVVWEASVQGNSLQLAYLSKNGEEGYPGNLQIRATYSLTEENELKLILEAKTDEATVCNLSNHSYFNLSRAPTILDHELEIFANNITPINSLFIPTGEYLPVEGTPFDFRDPRKIGEQVNTPHPQIIFGLGYDHNWVIKKEHDAQLTLLGRVYEPTTGRVLEILSTEPGLQFYCGNFLDGTLQGKGGKTYAYRSGFCLEPQHFPDSPNKPQFPSVVLLPNKTYRHTMIYRFSTR